MQKTYVWDLYVRIFHWSIALVYLLNHFILEGGERLHNWLGYLVVVLLVIRVIWGFIGSPYARFSAFVRGPIATLRYLGLAIRGKSPRCISHNPAGGWMMLALMALMGGAGISGWMMTLDAFWGVDWVESLHYFCSDTILILLWLHIGAAVIESLKHRENLILSMITGRKRQADND